MSTPHLRLSPPLGGGHPAVRSRRIHELFLRGATALVATVVALGIALQISTPNSVLVLAIVLGVLFVSGLVISTRYELTLSLLVLYLGLLDGPIKLISASQAASAIRDVLIFAIGLGMIVRLLASRKRVQLPPLSGWVLAFVVTVLIETVNPNTAGVLKIVGGFRQQLEWVPFFFFAYLLIRSKARFRQLFVLVGVIALANGLVSTVQTRLSPAQLASWGPGYSQLVEGTNGLGGRTFSSGGESHVRPPALGSDEGFGGAFGVLALPGTLALLATPGLRRRWPVALLCVGALLAVATSLQRTTVIGAVVAVVSFALLSFSSGRRMRRPIAALVVVVGLAVTVGAVLASSGSGGAFSRYASIANPEQAATTSINYREKTLTAIPGDIGRAPFGIGLSTVGAGAGFGGKAEFASTEGQQPSAESQFNYITDELGLPGLIVWIAFSINLLVIYARGVRRVQDAELRLDLVAIASALFGFTIMGFAGPTTVHSPGGPFFWSAAGIAAYWLARSARKGAPIRVDHG
jgi:hypothetical protein